MALPAEIAALSSSETRTLPAALLARMAGLVARVEALEAENATLKARVGRLEAENAALKAENAALRAEMEQPSKTPGPHTQGKVEGYLVRKAGRRVQRGDAGDFLRRRRRDPLGACRHPFPIWMLCRTTA